MKKIFFLILTVLFVSSGVASGEIFQHPGIEVSIGGLSQEAVGAHDPDYNFYWASIGLFNKYYIDDNWNVNLCGNVDYLWWTHKYNNDHDAFLVEVKLVLYRKISKNLSFGLGGGFGTLSQRNNLPGLGNSGIYGILTGRLNYKIDENYGVEIDSDHLSDAGRTDDPGNNVLALKVYYMW